MTQQSDTPDPARRQAVDRLIDDIRAARLAGKEVDDATIRESHPHLLPELAAELEKLRRIEAARRAAATPLMSNLPTQGAQIPSALLNDLEAPPSIQIPGYSILREISRGGQAAVFLATQLSTGRKIALKLMHDGPFASERAITRFRREVQSLAALNHPNIVAIIDTGKTPDGARFIAMNYIPGMNLSDYMKDRLKKDPADPSKLLRLFLKICDAVNAAHRLGIIHRDLKPSNIRVDDRGEPHILDFGLARTALDHALPSPDHAVSITGEFLGSLPWSSPEQAEGDPERIDIRTDVYSLGVILYQILTAGRFPYEVVGNIRDVLHNILTVDPTPPSKIAAALKLAKSKDPLPPRPLPAINETIEKIVLKSLAKKPSHRYQSAGDLGRDIARYLAGHPTSARTAQRKKAPLISRNWLIGAGATVLLVVIAIAAAIWRPTGPSQVAVNATIPAPPSAHTPTVPQPATQAAVPPPLVFNGSCHLEGDELVITPRRGFYQFVFGDPNWSNYDLTFQVKTGSIVKPEFLTLFHWKESDTFCQFLVGGFTNGWDALQAVANGQPQKEKATVRRRFEPDAWHDMRIEVRDSRYDCFVDGMEWCQGQDEGFTRGRIGFSSESKTRCRAIRVTDPQKNLIWSGPPDLRPLSNEDLDGDSLSPSPTVLHTDLLALADPSKDSLAGGWMLRDGTLFSSGGPAQIEFPHSLSNAYDFCIEFSRSAPGGTISLIGSKGGQPFEWVLTGDQSTTTGVSCLDGAPFDKNTTTIRGRRQWLPANQHHTLFVEVRPSILQLYVDNVQRLWVGNDKYTTLSLDPSSKPLHGDWLGLRVDGGPIQIESAVVLEMSKPGAAGAAAPLPPPSTVKPTTKTLLTAGVPAPVVETSSQSLTDIFGDDQLQQCHVDPDGTLTVDREADLLLRATENKDFTVSGEIYMDGSRDINKSGLFRDVSGGAAFFVREADGLHRYELSGRILRAKRLPVEGHVVPAISSVYIDVPAQQWLPFRFEVRASGITADVHGKQGMFKGPLSTVGNNSLWLLPGAKIRNLHLEVEASK